MSSLFKTNRKINQKQETKENSPPERQRHTIELLLSYVVKNLSAHLNFLSLIGQFTIYQLSHTPFVLFCKASQRIRRKKSTIRYLCRAMSKKCFHKRHKKSTHINDTPPKKQDQLFWGAYPFDFGFNVRLNSTNR